MRLGIYGGTFDPPHLGHLSALKIAVKQLQLDKTFIIPTNIPPHKEQSENMASCEDRLAMTKLCFEDLENVLIWDGEISRGGKSYSIYSVRQMREQYPDAELVLLMGTDMYMTLETWLDFDDLVKLVSFGVFIRNDGEEQAIIGYKELLWKKYGGRTELVHNRPVEVSSTELRGLLAKRRGREFLKDTVYGYIVEQGLYNVKADFDWLRCKAYDMLKERRIRHVAGCEGEAVKLARRWGCDTELAREAGILHDITKKYDLAQQLNLCEEYGIILDDTERQALKLLHAKTGAYIAKDRFNVCDEVFSAIYWHTTGKEDMSLLEKVIYLADYVEPNRDFDGVETLRALCYEDIDGALRLGLEMSIQDMVEQGIVPHERSAHALEWLKQTNAAEDV